MMKFDWSSWQNTNSISPRDFSCGYCGKEVASKTGYYSGQTNSIKIYICPRCGCPTFFNNNDQYPGALLGRVIGHLPKDIESIYKELRDSNKESNFTAVSLLGRKLIMHLAVSVAGAEEGKSFVAYIDHLKSSQYIPPKADSLLQYMRSLGNEKSHELKLGSSDEAQKLLKFIEVLLIFMFELPSEFGVDDE